jgi:glycosyltransferase involved in cell wall biosynthesis
MVVAMLELSVIVIGRNEAARIERCLRSVLASLENVGDYEVIYVDSASEDESVAIAARFPIRILQLRRHWTLTPSAGRFIGFRHAAGRFLAFVDGDTVLHPAWLGASCAFLRENPEFGGVAGAVDKACFSDDGSSAPADANRGRCDRQAVAASVPSLGGIATYRREAMEQAGTFNPFLPTGEECEVALRIRRAGYKLARIAAPMCVTHSLPPESIREIMRRSRAHLYDYGATLRYCLINGFAWRFSVEQMSFVYSFVIAVVALLAAIVISVATGAAWLLAGALGAAAVYVLVTRRRGKNLAVSLVKRSLMTYRTVLSFLRTRPQPVHCYPTDVVVVK